MNISELVTPMILTYNEEQNIERTLSGLKWAKQILVIDSFSTDKTLEILKKDSRTRILQRKFDNFANQCNFGLENVHTEWVLSLDADYVITSEWLKEATAINEGKTAQAYKIPLKVCVYGIKLRSSIMPPRICFYKKSSAHYYMDGHGHRVTILGVVSKFQNPILVDDCKKLSIWFKNQISYAEKETEKLTKSSFKILSFPDKLRKLYVIAPFIIFPYCFLLKLGFLDGWRGLYYALQRTFFELALSINLLDKKISSNNIKNQGF